jgi:predicted nucleic acid-binding protein
MSRIFWDSMLFVYLLEEGNEREKNRVRQLLKSSRDRRDSLFTSHLVLGEVLAGAHKSSDPAKTRLIREVLQEMGFSFLSFDAGAVDPFSALRSIHRVPIADSINLACAASAGIDLFLTNDTRLFKLHVPGIHFIADFNNPVL